MKHKPKTVKICLSGFKFVKSLLANERKSGKIKLLNKRSHLIYHNDHYSRLVPPQQNRKILGLPHF